MHNPSRELEIGSEKPDVVANYNANMGYVDFSDRMANSYTFGRKILKWTKKLFFHLLDLSILNAFILFKMKNPKGGLKNFRQNLIFQM
ncbi:PiggyBac transposable element-derived protein 4, partial [Stegodyphus mimosarum]